MTATNILAELTARGVILTPEGDRIRYRGPKKALTPELLEQVAKHKPELLAYLQNTSDLSPSGNSLVCQHPLAAHPARENGQAAPDPDLVSRLLGMDLGEFEREGQPLELKVPWLADNLWFVPQEPDAEALTKAGVSRGRVWTVKELLDLLSIPGLTKEQVQKIATAKAIFEGTVTA